MKVRDKRVEQRVFDSASRLIFQRGIRGWNMDQLASEAGIAKNTLYKIISSKEEFIKKVILNSVHQIQGQMIDIIETDIAYLEKMERMMSFFPELLGMVSSGTLQEVFLEYPDIQEAVLQHRDEMTNRIISFIGQGIANGNLRSGLQPEFVFQMLQAVVVYFVRSSPQGDILQQNLKQAFNYLLNGIRANPEV